MRLEVKTLTLVRHSSGINITLVESQIETIVASEFVSIKLKPFEHINVIPNLTDNNIYTLVFDLYIPDGSRNIKKSLFQTTIANNDDPELIIDATTNRVGNDIIGYTPDNFCPIDTWFQLVLAVNNQDIELYLLDGNGTSKNHTFIKR